MGGVVLGCLYVVVGVVGCEARSDASEPKGSTNSPTIKGRFDLRVFNEALAYRESSNNWTPKRGDNGKARGYWQYHWGRWSQFGGTLHEYDTLNKVAQVRIHGAAMRAALKTVPRGATVEQTITWLANYHNMGHGSPKVRPYTRDLVRLYKERL